MAQTSDLENRFVPVAVARLLILCVLRHQRHRGVVCVAG